MTCGSVLEREGLRGCVPMEMYACVQNNLFPACCSEAVSWCHFYFSDLQHSRNLFQINLKSCRFAFLGGGELRLFPNVCRTPDLNLLCMLWKREACVCNGGATLCRVASI